MGCEVQCNVQIIEIIALSNTVSFVQNNQISWVVLKLIEAVLFYGETGTSPSADFLPLFWSSKAAFFILVGKSK